MTSNNEKDIRQKTLKRFIESSHLYENRLRMDSIVKRNRKQGENTVDVDTAIHTEAVKWHINQMEKNAYETIGYDSKLLTINRATKARLSTRISTVNNNVTINSKNFFAEVGPSNVSAATVHNYLRWIAINLVKEKRPLAMQTDHLRLYDLCVKLYSFAKRIVFNEAEHSYTVMDDKRAESSVMQRSVTKSLDLIFGAFDSDLVATRMVNSPQWKRNALYNELNFDKCGNQREKSTIVEMLKARWNKTRNSGTILHSYINTISMPSISTFVAPQSPPALSAVRSPPYVMENVASNNYDILENKENVSGGVADFNVPTGIERPSSPSSPSSPSKDEKTIVDDKLSTTEVVSKNEIIVTAADGNEHCYYERDNDNDNDNDTDDDDKSNENESLFDTKLFLYADKSPSYLHRKEEIPFENLYDDYYYVYRELLDFKSSHYINENNNKLCLEWCDFVLDTVFRNYEISREATVNFVENFVPPKHDYRVTPFLGVKENCLRAFDVFDQKRFNDGWLLLASEFPVFDVDCGIAGSIDAIYTPYPDRPELVVLVDWKSCNIDFGTRYNQFAKGMKYTNNYTSHYPKCNYWKYAMQLNVYRELLERMMDGSLIVLDMLIVSLIETSPYPAIYSVPRLSDAELFVDEFKSKVRNVEQSW